MMLAAITEQYFHPTQNRKVNKNEAKKKLNMYNISTISQVHIGTSYIYTKFNNINWRKMYERKEKAIKFMHI